MTAVPWLVGLAFTALVGLGLRWLAPRIRRSVQSQYAPPTRRS